MIQRIGACILISSLGIGCGVGDDDKLEPLDPNPNRLVCTDAFKVTGSFVPGTPARPITDPEDPASPFTGCWPVGTWNFTLTTDPTDENILDITGDKKADRCGSVTSTSIATFDASYSFVVGRVADVNEDYIDTYTVTGQVPEGVKTLWNDKYVYKLKVTEGGGGECTGGLELYSRDGKSYWNLQPVQTGTSITGFGDFHLYEESQY